MTKDQISAKVGNLLGGDQSHPASITLGAISGIVDGNWEDATQPELNDMIGGAVKIFKIYKIKVLIPSNLKIFLIKR